MGIFPPVKFLVQGNSMHPCYKEGETVLINKFAYLLSSPKIGDVIVIIDPRDSRFILKRIAKIAQKKYFVLGDNEKESTDSRTFGWIIKKQIIGKVFIHLKQQIWIL